MKNSQNYSNHVRWLPPFHFFLVPLMLVNLIFWTVRIVQTPSWDRGMLIALSIGLVTLMLLSRTQTLAVQDRVILLEELLRYQNLLSGDLAERAKSLNKSQVIGLRFAGDKDLPDLVERALTGEFATQKDIKIAVKNWKADYLRA